jgi:hypothetical protein
LSTKNAKSVDRPGRKCERFGKKCRTIYVKWPHKAYNVKGSVKKTEPFTFVSQNVAARDKNVFPGPPDGFYAFFLAAAAVASYMMGEPIMMDA